MEWYRAWFCQEWDYQAPPGPQIYFDIVVNTEDERDTQCGKIEQAGWGAMTHWQYIGSVTPGDAMMLERKGEIVKANTCPSCKHHSITGSNDPCLNPESPQHGKGTDFMVACPFYAKTGPWVTLPYKGD